MKQQHYSTAPLWSQTKAPNPEENWHEPVMRNAWTNVSGKIQREVEILSLTVCCNPTVLLNWITGGAGVCPSSRGVRGSRMSGRIPTLIACRCSPGMVKNYFSNAIFKLIQEAPRWGQVILLHSVLTVWNWLKNGKSLAQKRWVMSLGPFHSARLKCVVLWKHPALNGGYVPKLVKGRILSNKSRSSWTNTSLCSSAACYPQSHCEKPPHIPHSCWINGLWFTSLSGGEHGSGLTVYMLPPPRAPSGVCRRDPSIIRWSIPSQKLMQSLLSPSEIDRDELCGFSCSRTAAGQVLHAFKHLGNIHF